MNIDVLEAGPLMVNCYILHENSKCVIIDPGGEFAKISGYIEKSGFEPLAIFNTHGHFDHIGAVAQLREKYNIDFYLHESDLFLVQESKNHGVLFGVNNVQVPEVDKYVKDGDSFDFDGIKFSAIHTPGHSPGGVCYYFEKEKALFSGDTLFDISIGRTDFPYGDMEMLVKSIKNKIFTLGDNISIFPGHGGKTNIKREKAANPFLK